MSDLIIEVQAREERGSNESRRLRSVDRLPAVVYGGGGDSVPITVARKVVLDLLKSSSGENTVFLLKLAGSDRQRHTMIHDMQVDPLTRKILHIDFLRIVMTEKVKVSIHVSLVGTPEGVKNEGGILEFMTREVEVECLPADIPDEVEVDISSLHIGQHVEAKDLTIPDKVALLEEAERVIASISAPKVAEEEEVPEDELLLEAEGEEPEVISRGKAEEEGEAEG